MEKISTKLEGVYIIKPTLFTDQRGWFCDNWSKKEWEKLGLNYNFVQDSLSFSRWKHTLRGLHFQYYPKAQAKMVCCIKGIVLDVVVDLRRESETYGQWISHELSEKNCMQLIIPKGFAHGFLTLSDNVVIQYKLDEYYYPEHNGAILWNDNDLSIYWCGVTNPILSERDKVATCFKDFVVDF